MVDPQHPMKQQPVEPLSVDTLRVILAGTLVWAIALVATLAVPALHAGERSWWPWACVTGLALGAIGLIYVRRDRGNAASARRG